MHGEEVFLVADDVAHCCFGVVELPELNVEHVFEYLEVYLHIIICHPIIQSILHNIHLPFQICLQFAHLPISTLMSLTILL